jgi:hypothetical protein
MFGKQVLYCLYICLVLVVWLLSAISSCTAVRVGQNQTYIYIHIYGVHVLQLGLAKTIHIYTVCIYCIFSREIAIHVYVYTVCICGIFRR